jgi:hypothetical protein
VDDDTSYVKSATVGNVDLYTMGTVSFTGTIFGVQVNVTHRKDDVGSRTITPLIRIGSTNYEGSLFDCQTDYNVAQKIFELDPSIAGSWTNSSVSAINAGVKIKG